MHLKKNKYILQMIRIYLLMISIDLYLGKATKYSLARKRKKKQIKSKLSKTTVFKEKPCIFSIYCRFNIS